MSIYIDVKIDYGFYSISSGESTISTRIHVNNISKVLALVKN